jgi:hypothetical protein
VQVTVRESILLLPLSPLTGLLSSFVVIWRWTETPRSGCLHHVRRSGLVGPRTIRGSVRRRRRATRLVDASVNTVRCGCTVGAAHCAFRAVGGAVALLHDDGRGLGIAHGRDM